MKVIKRDGTVVDFDRTKIKNAIQKAFYSVYEEEFSVVEDITEIVINKISNSIVDVINIEIIQDTVETALMVKEHDVAKAYILYREERSKQRKKRTHQHPDPLALSDYIHYAKYARHLPDKQRRETYLETSHRCRDMHLKRFCNREGEYQLGMVMRVDRKELKLYDLIMWAWEFVDRKAVLPSMRSMQFGGEAIENQNTRMYNCSFTHIDRPKVFQEIFYLLLCGCGVGFSVQKQHVSKLPIILQRDNKKLRHYTVEDSIQGWADSIGVLLDSFFTGYNVEFGYSSIRPQGTLLKISGGKAPGHFPLKKLHNIIIDKLQCICNRQLRPIECHDIICHIADSVLSGGIRRSSLISLFSIDDDEMLYSKMPGNFQYYGENGQRALSNNSAVLLRPHSEEFIRDHGLEKGNYKEKEQFLKIMELNKNNPNGEPGFFFTNNLDYGCNPCGEIGLYPVLDVKYEDDLLDQEELKLPFTSSGQIKRRESGIAFCNLTEINCAVIKTKEEFLHAVKAAATIGTLQAAYTDFKYLGGTTEKIARRDALLGVSLTGMMDNPSIALNTDIQSLGALMVSEVNKDVAELIGINTAKRLTTVKPSGTASLLLGGVGSGIHPHHSKRYFRRITANRNERILQEFTKFNPQMIEYKPNGDLVLIFPVEPSINCITLENMGVKNFLQCIFDTYDNWIRPGCNAHSENLTHNISCTVCFRPEEYDSMIETIWSNRNRIASMAFIPFMSDKMLPYMPRESVVSEEDEVRWNKLVKDYKPIDYLNLNETDSRSSLTLELACSRDNENCGAISIIVEDTVEIVTDLNLAQFKYDKVGTLKDSFGNELILVRRT